MARFDGKVVVVTGAASGIGRATAIRIAEEGGQVLASDWDLERVTETAKVPKDWAERKMYRDVITFCDISDVKVMVNQVG